MEAAPDLERGLLALGEARELLDGDERTEASRPAFAVGDHLLT